MTAARPSNLANLHKAAAGRTAVGLDAGESQLLAQQAGRAAAGGLSLAREGGFLQQMTKLVLQAGLEAEMSC